MPWLAPATEPTRAPFVSSIFKFERTRFLTTAEFETYAKKPTEFVFSPTVWSVM